MSFFTRIRDALESEEQKLSRKRATERQLVQAAATGDLPEVDALLQAGADVNAASQETTPLHAAVANKNMKVARLLISRGGDLNAGNPTAFYAAVETRSMKLIRSFLDHGADVNAGNPAPLHAAVRTYDQKLVRFFVKQGANVNGGNPPPVFAAAEGCDCDMVELLIRFGATIQGYTCNGRDNIIDVACGDEIWSKYGRLDSRHERMIELLLKNGASLSGTLAKLENAVQDRIRDDATRVREGLPTNAEYLERYTESIDQLQRIERQFR